MQIHFHVNKPPLKALLAEVPVKILKHRIYRYFTSHHTKSYIGHLPDFVKGINNRFVASIGMSPSQVSTFNQDQVWHRLYDSTLKKSEHPWFTVGNSVRLGLNPSTFSKGYQKTYSDEIYKIHKVLLQHPPKYVLVDRAGTIVSGVFYQEELKPVFVENSVEIKSQ